MEGEKLGVKDLLKVFWACLEDARVTQAESDSLSSRFVIAT